MNTKINDIVSEVVEVIHKSQDDIREIYADDVILGKYPDPKDDLVQLDKLLGEFLVKLAKFDNGVTEQEIELPTKVVPEPSESKRTKSPKSVLKVEIDGYTFCEKIAGKTFAQTINYLGPENIPLEIVNGNVANRNPLISKNKPTVDPKNNNPNYKKLGDYYIVTHFSNKVKKSILEEIAEALGKKIKVRLIYPPPNNN